MEGDSAFIKQIRDTNDRDWRWDRVTEIAQRLNNEVSELRARVEALQNENSLLRASSLDEGALGVVLRERDELRTELAEARSQNRALESDIRDLWVSNGELEAAMASASEQHRQELQCFATVSEGLQSELDSLQVRNRSLTTQLGELHTPDASREPAASPVTTKPPETPERSLPPAYDVVEHSIVAKDESGDMLFDVLPDPDDIEGIVRSSLDGAIPVLSHRLAPDFALEQRYHRLPDGAVIVRLIAHRTGSQVPQERPEFIEMNPVLLTPISVSPLPPLISPVGSLSDAPPSPDIPRNAFSKLSAFEIVTGELYSRSFDPTFAQSCEAMDRVKSYLHQELRMFADGRGSFDDNPELAAWRLFQIFYDVACQQAKDQKGICFNRQRGTSESLEHTCPPVLVAFVRDCRTTFWADSDSDWIQRFDSALADWFKELDWKKSRKTAVNRSI